jgi:hypothetical protein
MEDKAVEIIKLFDKEDNKLSSLRGKWQEVSDYQSPVDDQITTIRELGNREDDLLDETAKFDCQDMISGLSAALIPSGQQFYGLQADDSVLEEVDIVRRYLAMATEISHKEIFKSNFMPQLNEALRSLILYGPCDLYSEWDKKILGLNYHSWPIGSYVVLEDNHSNVDTILLKHPLTARQAYQQFVEEWGVKEENLGKSVLDALKLPDTENNSFDFIWKVGRRNKRNPQLKDNKNWEYESVYVNVKDKTVVDEGGFQENPHSVARWLWSATQKYGTGQGMMVRKTVKALQKMQKNLLESGDKWNDPAREVLDSFEGRFRVYPGAVNRVQQLPSSRAIDQTMNGNFPITKDIIEMVQGKVDKAYFKDIFVQLADLTGDRRTTVEIIERLKEGLRRLALPVMRLQSELLNPVIIRSVLLLIRNGIIPMPPRELQGRGFGIEYKGTLALALKSQQAKGFMQFAEFITNISPVFSDAVDYIDMEDAMPDMAASFGVKNEHIASEEQVLAKRKARAEKEQKMENMQAGQVLADAYNKGVKAPEQGSASGKLMEAAGVK